MMYDDKMNYEVEIYRLDSIVPHPGYYKGFLNGEEFYCYEIKGKSDFELLKLDFVKVDSSDFHTTLVADGYLVRKAFSKNSWQKN